MDTLSDLGFFVLLSKLGSLSAAAQELGVTPPTTSKRLAALEQRLGVRLLNRTTRRMSLTAEGEIFLAEGSRLLHELTQLEQRLSGARAAPCGLLRVHATLGFGRRHIAPAVSSFAARYAEVEVQLQLSDRLPNLVEQGFDVAVRIGELADARLTARTLAANARVLCASPDYLHDAGEPARPADLQSHQCIVIRESDETYGAWQLSQGGRRETVKVRGRLATNDGAAALDWALAGHGILLRSQWDVARHLRAGRLRLGAAAMDAAAGRHLRRLSDPAAPVREDPGVRRSPGRDVRGGRVLRGRTTLAAQARFRTRAERQNIHLTRSAPQP